MGASLLSLTISAFPCAPCGDAHVVFTFDTMYTTTEVVDTCRETRDRTKLQEWSRRVFVEVVAEIDFCCWNNRVGVVGLGVSKKWCERTLCLGITMPRYYFKGPFQVSTIPQGSDLTCQLFGTQPTPKRQRFNVMRQHLNLEYKNSKIYMVMQPQIRCRIEMPQGVVYDSV